jgi:hypothetical protein
VKAGDIVVRKNIWAQWQRYNKGMTFDDNEVGIVIKQGKSFIMNRWAIMWSSQGLQWEPEEELEVVSESR